MNYETSDRFHLPRTDEVGPTKSPARDARSWSWVEDAPRKLTIAALAGGAFGFLLQKGGVAKLDILVGVLLLENFVVAKVMLSAIVVGMVGAHVLAKRGVLELDLPETSYGANLVGGLVFGLGFGLLGYCPGTDAAAVGQGNFDALIGVAGMVIGSHAFAVFSRYRNHEPAKQGKLTLPGLVGVSRGRFILVFAPLLVAALVLLELFGP